LDYQGMRRKAKDAQACNKKGYSKHNDYSLNDVKITRLFTLPRYLPFHAVSSWGVSVYQMLYPEWRCNETTCFV